MSYIGRYERFIEALKHQPIVAGMEVHHIVPKSMGGSNDKSNLISLTPRQHYIAHWMLWKAYGGKMAQAFFFFNNYHGKRISSKAYEQLRSESLAGISGANHYLYGKKIPAESRLKMSEKRREYMAKPEARENLRKHRANQVIPKEAYARQAKVMSSLVWLNDGVRSYRIKPEYVNQKLQEGLVKGRLMTHLMKEA